MPVEVLGLSGTPAAGDKFAVVENESRAREISEYRQRLAREKAVARHVRSAWFARTDDDASCPTAGVKEFPLVIKGDVQGSIEAIAGALDKLAPTKSGPASSIRALAASPSRISRWPKHRMPPSSASTSVPTRRPARRPSAQASRSATTTSSTIWWMT